LSWREGACAACGNPRHFSNHRTDLATCEKYLAERGIDKCFWPQEHHGKYVKPKETNQLRIAIVREMAGAWRSRNAMKESARPKPSWPLTPYNVACDVTYEILCSWLSSLRRIWHAAKDSQ
jgi:hypothetical protein